VQAFHSVSCVGGERLSPTRISRAVKAPYSIAVAQVRSSVATQSLAGGREGRRGVVAVLDARTDLPVIGYGSGGIAFLREAGPGMQRAD
jgi:hypothetical protein